MSSLKYPRIRINTGKKSSETGSEKSDTEQVGSFFAPNNSFDESEFTATDIHDNAENSVTIVGNNVTIVGNNVTIVENNPNNENISVNNGENISVDISIDMQREIEDFDDFLLKNETDMDFYSVEIFEKKESPKNKQIIKTLEDNEIQKDILGEETREDISDNETRKDILRDETREDISNNETQEDILDGETRKDISDNEIREDSGIREKKSSPKIFWDSKYDGDIIRFYDYKNEIICEKQASVYIGATTVIGTRNSTGLYRDPETKNFAIINPDEEWKVDVKKERIYDWFLLKVISEEFKISMNTLWEPVYITKIKDCDLYEKNPTRIFICYSKDLPDFPEYHSKYILVPLLDTIIQLHQEYFNFSLMDIGMSIIGKYDPDIFHDQIKTLKYVFEKFKAEIMEVCQIEITSIHRLYDSNFNLYFRHSKTGLTKKQEIHVATYITNVVSRPSSLEYHEKSYGNIPYLIRSIPVNKKTSETTKIYENGPISYSKATSTNKTLSCTEFFLSIIIFPKTIYLEKNYPSFYMGIVEKNIGTREFVLRGKIFEGITVRENLIIYEMYIVFCAGALTVNKSFLDCHSNLVLNADQIVVRSGFISFIQKLLVNCTVKS